MEQLRPKARAFSGCLQPRVSQEHHRLDRENESRQLWVADLQPQETWLADLQVSERKIEFDRASASGPTDQ